MSQKWTWSEKDIHKGDKGAILGLLEDLHRFFNGLPRRKKGDEYFSDGPYIGTLNQVLDETPNQVKY